jgi:hypothetical protein
MLYAIESDTKISTIPHNRDFQRWRQGITDPEYEAIVDELNSRIEGTEVQTSSWIPGAEWGGTVFDPIYTRACNLDERAAAKFFGLVVWDTFMRHGDWWAFGRYEKDGTPIEGLTYFKIDPPR